MELSKENIATIKKGFENLQSKEDLVDLLNQVKKMTIGDDYNVITIESFNYYCNPQYCTKRYKRFEIAKKTGGKRVINAPYPGLKKILRPLNTVLQVVYDTHPAATGFVLNSSVVDNARKHLGQNYVYNIDLKDFFHSFDLNQVKMGLTFAPNGLSQKKIKLAFFIASLVTHPFAINGETKRVLPQGAPTSPTLTNILCVSLDRRLTGFAKRFGVKYSRYADDITFSSQHKIYKKKEFQEELHRIIIELNLEINPKKTRLIPSSYKQEITGLTANEKVNVSRKYIKQLRMWLHYWEIYGKQKAQDIFRKDYLFEKGHVKKVNPDIENVIFGKLNYLKMVKGEEDSTYLKLLSRYKKLVKKESRLSKLLSTWEREGIEAAMAEYYKQNENNKSMTA